MSRRLLPIARRKVWCNMPVHNADVAAVFEEIADLLEIEGSNPFRLPAYHKAARTIRDIPP